jgi:hypothetical protein
LGRPIAVSLSPTQPETQSKKNGEEEGERGRLKFKKPPLFRLVLNRFPFLNILPLKADITIGIDFI